MSEEIEEFTRLKKELSQLDAQLSRREGKIEALLETLKSELGCSSVAAAESKLKKLETQYSKLEKSRALKLRKFVEQWRDVLAGDEEED